MFLAGIGLRNHIHMCLKNYGNAVFHAFGGGLAENQVAGLVFLAIDFVLFGPFHHPGHEFLFMF